MASKKSKLKSQAPYWVIKDVDTDEYWLSYPMGNEKLGTNKKHRLRFETLNEAKSVLRDLQDQYGDELKVVKVTSRREEDEEQSDDDNVDQTDESTVEDAWFALQNHHHDDEFWSVEEENWVTHDDYARFDDPHDAYVTAGQVASKHEEPCKVVKVELLSDDTTRVKALDTDVKIPRGTVFIWASNPTNPFIVTNPPPGHMPNGDDTEVWHVSMNNNITCYGTVQEFQDEVDEGTLKVVYEP